MNERRSPTAPVLVGAGAWVALVVACGALYARMPPSPDQEIFDHIGWVAARGGTYYVDVAEQNWPGKMFMHELGMRLLGNHGWTFRVFDYLCMLLGLWALIDLLRSDGQRRAAVIVAFLYPPMYATAGPWMSGQRDVVAAHLLLLASAVFARRLAGGAGWLSVVTGAVVAAAVLIRPTYLAFAPGLILVDWLLRARTGRPLSRRLLDAAGAAAATLAVPGGVVLWGWSSGALDDFYEQSVQFNLQGYQDHTSRLSTMADLALQMAPSWHWYLAFGALGYAAVAWRRRIGVSWWIGLGVMAVGLLSAFAQNKGFGYHLGAWIPGLAVGIALWLAVLFEEPLSFRQPRLRGLLAAGCAALAVAGLASKAHTAHVRVGPNAVAQAAAFARERTRPDDRILVWSRSVGIYPLAERRSTTRFATVGMLMHAKPPFVAAEAWHAQFAREMREHPPALIFVSHEWHDKPAETDAEQRVQALLRTAYRHAADFGADAAYVLR